MTSNATRVGDWLASAGQALSGSRRETGDTSPAALDVQVVLAHRLQKSRAWLLAHPEAEIPPGLLPTLNDNLDRLLQGTPLPYLTDHQEFYGLDFYVTPAVLIPRPETELLVEHALEWLRQHPGARRAADVGTGSGCIAASLAHHIPNLRVLAVDRSCQALLVARVNMEKHSVSDRVNLLASDLLTAAAGPFDLVCANLPYIPSATLAQLEVARHEPRSALDGGLDGLAWIAALLADSQRWLAPGGLMLLEIEAGQGESAARLAERLCPGAEIQVALDWNDNPRLLSVASPVTTS